MNKKLILGGVFALVFAVVGGWVFTQSVTVSQAVNSGSQWSDWSDIAPGCVASQCDSSVGTKSQIRTCLLGGGIDACIPAHTTDRVCENKCPVVSFSASLGRLSFGPVDAVYNKIGKHCYRPSAISLDVPVWAYPQYVDKLSFSKNLVNVCTGGEYVPAQTETENSVSCTATVTPCDVDSYWCLPVGDSDDFTRVSVTSTPETGFKWSIGMDSSCKFPVEGDCVKTCGYAGGTVADGNGGTKTCAATEPCPTIEWCTSNGEGSFKKETLTVGTEKTGKLWEEGMDDDCNITCHKNIGDGTCRQAQQASCNLEENEIVGACDCRAETPTETTSTDSTYLTCQVPEAGTCSTECGYAGGDVVNDGLGGHVTCVATAACGNSSGNSGSSGGAVLLTHGYYSPQSFVFLINKGATTTNDKKVKLTIDAGADATKMAFSNSEDFSASFQQTYATSAEWTLSDGNGSKKVYAKFFNEFGEKSEIVSSTISLNGEARVETVVPQVLGQSTYNFTRNLYWGSRGEDVKALQQFLIDANVGPDARSLAKLGATGYFGPYTKMALVEYQKSVGIWAAGNFGPITRAYVNGLTQ